MVKQFETKSKGRRRLNQVCFNKILAAGKEQIMITKKEWKLETPPGAHILRKYLKKEYKVATLKDESGWLVKRV